VEKTQISAGGLISGTKSPQTTRRIEGDKDYEKRALEAFESGLSIISRETKGTPFIDTKDVEGPTLDSRKDKATLERYKPTSMGGRSLRHEAKPF